MHKRKPLFLVKKGGLRALGEVRMLNGSGQRREIGDIYLNG